MEQEQKIIQKLHQHATKIQQKLDRYILKLEDLPFQAHPATSQKYQSYNNYVGNKLEGREKVEQRKELNKKQEGAQSLQSGPQYQDLKQLQMTKRQIQRILKQYEHLLSNNQSLAARYLILRQSRKELYEEITSLKAQLQKNKQRIQKCTKLQQQLSKLEQEFRMESIAANKLQQALNNSTKLQIDISQKLKQIQDKECAVVGKLQKERQNQIEVSNYWRDYEKWNKLMEHQSNIQKHIEYQEDESGKQYNAKAEQKKKIQEKVKSIDKVYEELNIAVSEQEYIIKEIMLRQQITSYQLFSAAREQFGDEGNADEENEQEYEDKINVFKNQIGLKEDSMKMSRMMKNKTQPVVQSQVEQQMRLTAKIPQYQIKGRQSKNLRKNAQKKSSLPSCSSPNIHSKNGNFSSLPKINSNDPRNSKSFMMPVTHKNENFPNPNYNKRASYDTYSNKNRSSTQSVLIKGGLYGGSEDSEKFSELKRNVRIRTRDGYKYYGNSDKIESSRVLNQPSEQSVSQNLTEYNNRERMDIIKIYDKLASQRNSQKNEYESQERSQISQNLTAKQDEEDKKIYENHIKLQTAKNKRKGKFTYKEQMESRESDTDQKRTIRKNSFCKESEGSQRKNISKREKTSQEQTQGKSIRKRLNTIVQDDQQANNLGASFK